MNSQIGFKELYDVTLKATYSIEVSGRKFEKGEVVAKFDNIALAQFNEIKSLVAARGGFDNRARVYWEKTKELTLSFTQGVFSKTQMALLTNAKLINRSSNEPLLISKRETIESDETGSCTLQHVPHNIFIYDKQTGDRLSVSVTGQTFNITTPFKEVIVDYEYEYNNKSETLTIGRALTEGYLSFTAKTRMKDDVTGQVKTGIINIPKIKLMSDLSMVLGENATPQIGKFDAVAIPVGYKGSQVVMEIIMLDDDIDSDM